jgi:hypothetical protein
MGLRIEPLREDHLPDVRDLNRRLCAANVAQGFLLADSVPKPLDRTRPVFKEHYVVADERGVHGGFMLQHQDFSINGRTERIGNYQMPISEGVIDRNYAPVGMLMLREALRIHPRLFALGMGGRGNLLPRMLEAMGWRLWDVPFLFHVHRPARFLRHIAALRSSASRRLLMDAAAASGAGWIGIRVMQARRAVDAGVAVEEVADFGPWADDLWERCAPGFSFCAQRTRAMLNLQYPRAQERYLRLKMSRAGAPVGWVVLLDTQMRQDRHFGNLRVGTIADGVAAPGDIAPVLSAAVAMLQRRGVDLTVSNQAHEDWTGALRQCGFLSGPSNYVFAASKPLSELLVRDQRMHITRGDGEGPLSL